MRASKVGLILVCGGLGMIVLAVFTLFKGVAQSTGGSYGRQPMDDFIGQHFSGLGVLVAVIGLIVWLTNRFPARARTAHVPETTQATIESVEDTTGSRAGRREFQGVDQFGWPHTIVAVQAEDENADGRGAVAGLLSLYTPGGGGLIRIQQGLYEDPASKARIRCDDPDAP
ncbi:MULTISPECIES: hypothetical protein [Lysobacter]|uniref:hypothetical protein n=1 Tax=Lysobacter TaxID=68 RepID=UPI001F19C9A9|nr:MULTISPECIES: hypothetical protein [Lysobacter]UJB19188.1 hypothetical protein L1A79_23230 [Lysobacter capsici]UJQ27087.1 hypothetical protein L2D09_16655 [Lysobacter gummosus]